jgi:hypothetical protein
LSQAIAAQAISLKLDAAKTTGAVSLPDVAQQQNPYALALLLTERAMGMDVP